MPVGLAGVGGAAVFPPDLTVLFAEGHVQDPLFAPALVHLGGAGGREGSIQPGISAATALMGSRAGGGGGASSALSPEFLDRALPASGLWALPSAEVHVCGDGAHTSWIQGPRLGEHS